MKLVVTIDLPHATEGDAHAVGRDLLELLAASVAVGAYEPIDTQGVAAGVLVHDS